MGYETKWRESYISPLLASVPMALVAGGVYYGLYALIHINIVCLGISVILAVAVYAAAYLILSKPTQEDILMIPGGTHLLRLASKLHLM